ncbi:hypothetical protein V6N11_006426 [Hibiscus sabdariffa]|uniref:Bifunctional inhibitor/plant lipid transfer protein/seed storage helical domain-containing protein n=1 Tax=Hibiscus sabdariffa TaxID=183260 RepID=A0ABR2RR38_9ROSI
MATMGRSLNITLVVCILLIVSDMAIAIPTTRACMEIRKTFGPCMPFLKGKGRPLRGKDKPTPACCLGGRKLATKAKLNKKVGLVIWECVILMVAEIGDHDQRRLPILGRICTIR